MFLAVPTKMSSFECSYVAGTLKSSSGLTIKGVQTKEECSRVCWEKRTDNIDITGVTVRDLGGAIVTCQCEINFKVVKTHETCFIGKKQKGKINF